MSAIALIIVLGKVSKMERIKKILYHHIKIDKSNNFANKIGQVISLL